MIFVIVVAILALSQVTEWTSVVCRKWLIHFLQTELGKEITQCTNFLSFIVCMNYHFNKLLHSSFLFAIKIFFFLIITVAFTNPKTRCQSPESREKTRKRALHWRSLNVVIIVLKANLHETKSYIKREYICTISHSNPNVWREIRMPWQSRKAATGREMSIKKQKISAPCMAKLFASRCTWKGSLVNLWF